MRLNYKKLLNKPKTDINQYKYLETFVNKEQYPNQPLIEVKDLKHSFRVKNKEKIIYKNINFDIFENERLAFLGPNGAGKTLTVSTICGIFKPKAGNIKYNFNYDHVPYEKLSVQFQDLQFPSSLTPKDLIDFSLKLINDNYEEYEDEILRGLEIFEIKNILNTKISKLSGGQQQRVNVFIAMLGRPKVLFLDEFTTGLDIAIKNKIQNYILEFCDKYKITLVIISHDIDCIEEMVDRIIILADQRIMIDAYSKDIIAKYGSVKEMLKQYIIV